MKIFKIFTGHRFFIISALLILIAFLIVWILIFKGGGQAPAQVISNLVFGFVIFNLLVFLMALAGISDSIKVIKAVKEMFNFTEEIKKENFEATLEIKRKDEVGKLAKNLDIMRNVLEKSFNDLKEEKEKATLIIQNVGEAILVIDKERKIILANPAVGKIIGLKEEEIKNKKYFEVLKFFDAKKESFICQEPKGRDCLIEKAISSQKRIDIPEDICLINNYGNKIYIGGNISPFPLKDSYIFSFHDTTMEREIDRMKSEFISIASHQLRTPLSSVRWYAEMLLAGDAGKLRPKQADFLEDIYNSIIVSIDLINNLLDVHKIEANGISLEIKKIQIEEVIEGAILKTRSLAAASNIKIIRKFEKSLPKIKGDFDKLSQVFSNVISNAVIYNRGGGDIVVSLEKDENKIIFSCKDNGIGIPLEEQKNIFKKFYRGSNTASIGVSGSGIGLYVCKIYVEEMGGRIWFQSKGINKGTTFYVSLSAV